MIRRILVEDADAIYQDQVGAGHLMDWGKIDNAVSAPFQSAFGTDAYPTVVEKAVKMLEGISRAQAYSDGNKRLAWLVMTTFLQINGLDIIEITAEEAADFTLKIDGTREGLVDAALWLSERLRPFPAWWIV